MRIWGGACTHINASSSGTPARRAATIPVTPLLRAALSASERFAADIATSGSCRNSPSFRGSVARFDKNSFRPVAFSSFCTGCLGFPFHLSSYSFSFRLSSHSFSFHISSHSFPFATDADFLTALHRDGGIVFRNIDLGLRHWNLSNLKLYLFPCADKKDEIRIQAGRLLEILTLEVGRGSDSEKCRVSRRRNLVPR